MKTALISLAHNGRFGKSSPSSRDASAPRPHRPWLSLGAIGAILIASAVINAASAWHTSGAPAAIDHGATLWPVNAAGHFAVLDAVSWRPDMFVIVGLGLVVALVVCEILGARFWLHARAILLSPGRSLFHRAWDRAAISVVLGAFCIVCNGFAAHRAIGALDAHLVDGHTQALDAHRAQVDTHQRKRERIERDLEDVASQIAALPVIQPDLMVRRQAQAAHNRKVELARLDARQTALSADLADLEAHLVPPPPAPPRGRLASHEILALVVLIEALKAFGYWALDGGTMRINGAHGGDAQRRGMRMRTSMRIRGREDAHVGHAQGDAQDPAHSADAQPSDAHADKDAHNARRKASAEARSLAARRLAMRRHHPEQVSAAAAGQAASEVARLRHHPETRKGGPGRAR